MAQQCKFLAVDLLGVLALYFFRDEGVQGRTQGFRLIRSDQMAQQCKSIWS